MINEQSQVERSPEADSNEDCKGYCCPLSEKRLVRRAQFLIHGGNLYDQDRYGTARQLRAAGLAYLFLSSLFQKEVSNLTVAPFGGVIQGCLAFIVFGVDISASLY